MDESTLSMTIGRLLMVIVVDGFRIPAVVLAVVLQTVPLDA
jgi:hypothetical protein